jgi:hypothetical protein
MQSDIQNVQTFQNIGYNIISIFATIFIFMIFFMYMFYASSSNKIDELSTKISRISKERDLLFFKVNELSNKTFANCEQNYEIENNYITKQDFNNFIQVFKHELEKKDSIQKTNLPVVKQYYPKQAHINPIREMFPVPIIPGGEYLKKGVISMRNMDYPYQDLTTTYQRVGTIATVNKMDDYMMTLYRRDIAPERDLYEYKVIDHTNGNNIEIFLNTNVALLRNGDKIIIPGYESKGEFIVNLDRQYSYIRLRPFP